MKLRLYNSLARQKEELVVQKKEVTVYSCGPTVYNYAHIGNLRTYVFMDLLYRVLAYAGYKTNGVINITDVGHLLSDADEGEDKMAQAARQQKKTPQEIAAYYTAVFIKDCKKLNIVLPKTIAKATDYIKEMLDFVVGLQKKGFAYETSDGIYFDISKFPSYGKLSGLKLDEQKAGARVLVNKEKKGPYDFALWKKAEKNHIMQWDSPWGKGYPGWHIECSAMCKKFFGDQLDIHTGGVDHIPVHHENEIAQNEALAGKKTVNFWLHGAFMLVDGGKMSKSLKNTYTISDLEERGFSALDFRFFTLNAHYRKELNFTFKGLKGAKTSRENLISLLQKHKTAIQATAAAKPSSEIPLTNTKKATLVGEKLQKKLSESTKKTADDSSSRVQEYTKKFEHYILDDLNIPAALGILFTMLKENKSYDIYKAALKFDKVLSIGLDEETPIKDKNPKAQNIPPKVLELANKRLQAKNDKNWAKADELRTEIQKLGYTVKDTKDGFELVVS